MGDDADIDQCAMVAKLGRDQREAYLKDEQTRWWLFVCTYLTIYASAGLTLLSFHAKEEGKVAIVIFAVIAALAAPILQYRFIYGDLSRKLLLQGRYKLICYCDYYLKNHSAMGAKKKKQWQAFLRAASEDSLPFFSPSAMAVLLDH